MSEIDLHIRCQRCGTEMELRDPAPGAPWRPDQFWVCPRCGRHFWSTYPPPNREKPKPAAEAAKPTAEPTS
jgi:DNA-directed RNA polymerase subunit RPC12/RpoP